MARSLITFAVLALAMAAVAQQSAVVYSTQAASDQITSLPGINVSSLPFRMFSGYLNVPNTGRQLFYWFVESYTNPSSAPIALWTNGGPGCSGLIGLMTEQGPFQPAADGLTLMINDFAWNKIANMLFIEAPAGVGFSYSTDPKDYSVGDARTASDNYQLILQFLARYPALANNDFHITSESYGGHYMPTLAQAIVNGNRAGKNPKINFKGFAVGNPYTDPDSNGIFGQFPTFWGRSLISMPTWTNLQQHCVIKPDSQCDLWQDQAMNEVGDLDPYGLDWPVCRARTSQQKRLIEMLLPEHRRRFSLVKNKQPTVTTADGVEAYPYDPCAGDHTSAYLNRADVIKAIHANPNLGRPWYDCSNVVRYNMTELQVPMEPIYTWLLNSGEKLKILVYSGDDDSVCATLGSQYWIYNMKLSTVQPWSSWTYNQQVGGYLVKFKGLSFVTAHGAGHMVPAYKPELGLEIFKRYLSGQWF